MFLCRAVFLVQVILFSTRSYYFVSSSYSFFCTTLSLSLCLSPCLGKARFGLWDEGSEFPQKSGSLVAFLEFQHVGFRVPVGPDGLERQVFFRRRLARRFLPQGNVQNNLVYGLSSLDQSNLVVVGWIHRLQDFKRTDAQFLPPMFG